MRLPNLYLKWHGFRELFRPKLVDKTVGVALFGTDGAETFAKLLRGDNNCTSAIADKLTAYMRHVISNTGPAHDKGDVAWTLKHEIIPTDLELPTLSFMARLVETDPPLPPERLKRAHSAILRDLTMSITGKQPFQLTVERYAMDRSFEGVMPSGGQGPVVFVAGEDKGQVAVLGVNKAPLAAYTLFARDPTGKSLWEMSWGESVLWLPSPSQPILDGGRLLLMPQAQPVTPTPGHFHVTTALIWDEEAHKAIEPRVAGTVGPMDELETALFLTRLRRVTDDRRGRWKKDAVSVLTASYVVKTEERGG